MCGVHLSPFSWCARPVGSTRGARTAALQRQRFTDRQLSFPYDYGCVWVHSVQPIFLPGRGVTVGNVVP